VLEVPSHSIGHGRATSSLYGHAPEVQISRWGLPIVTNVFMPDLDMREEFNCATPQDDLKRFAPQIGLVAEKLTDDVMDVILTLATNTALADGVAPDKARTRGEFPYFEAPYTSSEQAEIVPARPTGKK
jgi:hypothetical protein